MVDIEGISLDADTREFLRLNEVRGVCLFRKNLGTEDQIRQLTADLREVMGQYALIAIDQEGGSVARVTTLPQAPAAMGLGAIDDDATTEEVGAAVARGLRSLGINWNFAPVVDVNNNPANPVIGERSFSCAPEQVARLAHAWMRGAMREGVACCIKHFPGHGDTHIDSHHALPVVDKSLAELESLELLPFRVLSGVAPSVMTAHIVYPQIDSEYPATLSRAMLTGVLRQSMGYQGVVITDALMMKAVHDLYGHARASVLALSAGADMVLAQGNRTQQMAALRAIDEALANGSIVGSCFTQARERLQALALRFPAHAIPYEAKQRAQDEAHMRHCWLAGLAAIGNPVAPRFNTPLRVITQDQVVSDGVSEAGLPSAEVKALFSSFESVEFVCVPELRCVDGAVFASDGRRNILVSNHRSRYVVDTQERAPDLHLVLWNPFQVMDISAPAVVTWGYSDGAMEALKAWLQCKVEARGVPPVSLNRPRILSNDEGNL
jgi:beta-N-acetylhexosaminidase